MWFVVVEVVVVLVELENDDERVAVCFVRISSSLGFSQLVGGHGIPRCRFDCQSPWSLPTVGILLGCTTA